MVTDNVTFVDHTVHETNTWLNELKQEMNVGDEQEAYHALRGVLFALRDRLPLEEAIDFSSQLPMLVRGLFFEGYQPSGKPERIKHKDEFIQRVNQ